MYNTIKDAITDLMCIDITPSVTMDFDEFIEENMRYKDIIHSVKLLSKIPITCMIKFNTGDITVPDSAYFYKGYVAFYYEYMADVYVEYENYNLNNMNIELGSVTKKYMMDIYGHTDITVLDNSELLIAKTHCEMLYEY